MQSVMESHDLAVSNCEHVWVLCLSHPLIMVTENALNWYPMQSAMMLRLIGGQEKEWNVWWGLQLVLALTYSDRQTNREGERAGSPIVHLGTPTALVIKHPSHSCITILFVYSPPGGGHRLHTHTHTHTDENIIQWMYLWHSRTFNSWVFAIYTINFPDV